jgi:cholesterol oxidase
LGRLTRTNSESILGAGAPKDDPRDFTEGVAITSSFHPDEHTHIEPVRYGRGSNVMSLLTSVLTDDVGDKARWRVWLRQSWQERATVRQLYDFKHWSEHTVIALVMQSLDNSINTFPKRNRVTGRITLSSEQGHGAPNPTWIPLANEAVRRMARIVGGFPAGNIGEQFHRPLTAHFIGGCAIGKDADHGVVDAYHRVFGYDGLHIVDGSAVSANLGVNPSLTITAQAERAMAYWPNKGEADARPVLGAAYQSVAPVAPAAPIVPASAPGALRLPIVGIS